MSRLLPVALLLLTPWPAVARAQTQTHPVSDIRYELTFNARTAGERLVEVEMGFRVAAATPVLLSLPGWTPGAYEIAYFARHVRAFAATQDGQPLHWDKADPDTWRVRPTGRGEVRVTFRVLAADLDNARSWAREDFAMVNGTTVFPYPEGMGFDFGATVRVATEPGWRVATGMRPTGSPNTYAESSYHDLVDMPLFIGRFDLDSAVMERRVVRVASWPEGAFRGPERLAFLRQLGQMVPPMAKVFDGIPWDHYTTLLIFEPGFGGASALEHQNSHVGIYATQLIGSALLPLITAHEVFHGWNVKRLRPVDLWPYRYDQPQPTTWLWMSEGITDYYADLAMARGGIVDSVGWLGLTQEKVDQTNDAPPTALEDASLSAWIAPTDGSAYVYYPKGGLVGLLLDILIRDATDNARSLDHVLRALYQSTWRQGRGFTAADWWGAVRAAAGGASFDAFAAKYVDGREPLPWAEVLPKAGLRMVADTARDPWIGVSTSADTSGAIVLEVVPGSLAARAGVQVGDRLLSVGGVPATGEDFWLEYRDRYAELPEGTPVALVLMRGEDRLTLQGPLALRLRPMDRLEFDPAADARAVRIRQGLIRGTP